jgi:DDE superfamily endonuclease/helix-turn-helix, Psq domain/Tc5 transposase DNA-binding domain
MDSNSTESRLILALQALENDPNLSMRRAASIYNIPRKTLSDRRDGKPSRRDIQPKSRKLTDSEESVIVQYILHLDSKGFPPRLSGVEDMANRLLAERSTERVGQRWASNFVRRHPELATRYNRKYDYQRAKCEDPELIRGWFRLLHNTIAKYGVVESDIYNFDETGFLMGVITTCMVVTSSERRGRAKSKQPGNREWVTVIQGVNAVGWALPPFVVVKGTWILTSWYESIQLPRDWRVAPSANGWTTNEIGLDWIQHFEKHTQPRKVGAYRLLVLDGHDSHHSADFELYCQEHNIITLCMPPHSSHILQPLDVGCFSPLKTVYGKQIEGFMRGGQTHITKEDFFPAFKVAFQEAITPENIQGGFRGAGIAPFSPEKVLEGLGISGSRPNTAQSSGSRPRTAQSWQPQTPSNAAQASNQSIYIKNRLSQHQGSSPTPIIDAVDQFTKGSVAIMHEVALLRSRITELEAANERLSKRQRLKKKRLQKGGSLSVGEAMDIIGGNSGGGDLGGDLGGNRGGEGSEPRPLRRCGNCGETGHNARTCQVELEASSDDN